MEILLKEKIDKAKTRRFACLWLWLFPTHKYTSDGFDIYFKKIRNKIILMKMNKSK